MNYGIFKNGNYLSGDEGYGGEHPPASARAKSAQDRLRDGEDSKKKAESRRRLGCMTLLLPLLILVLYVIIKSVQ